jgi:hypothetical protein
MNRETLNKCKQELKNYIYDKRWIEERLEDIKERRSLLDKITKELTDMPKGSPKVTDPNIESLVKIMDDTEEIEKYIQDLRKKQIEIENKIDKLDQPYRNILYFRYIKGHNLTEVSGEIEEEYDYTRKLHGIALLKYAQLGEDDGRYNK